MNTPRLSFCIATLNRGHIIGETLESIITQATSEVEIVIVDGASTDNTTEVVQSFQQRFPNIQYLRLPAKGGVDRDYCRTVELAQGEYCWLFSDDDLLKPGAVANILQAIEQGHDLVIVNSEVRTYDFSQLVLEKLLKADQDRTYKPSEFEQFFADAGFYLSFIGGVVIRRQAWVERQKEPFFGTEFIHVGVIFQQPLSGTVLVLAKPWIMLRHSNASWFSRYFEIWMFKWPNLIWSFANFSAEAKSKVTLKEPWRNPKVLLMNRARGSYTLAEYERFVQPASITAHERWLAQLIARFPGWIVNMGVLVYFLRFHPSDKMSIAEFRGCRYALPNIWARWMKGSQPA